ncbi:unnamed protein product [Schistosoma mattheei]|uniref:Uncharacterized protein n=1 Tax=Schistosoma mattheei TaxID=31246 RepID=A0A183NRP0_9TREM|nr:unnamed protein product [Schistosoma mattheei]
MVVGSSRLETLDPGFVLYGTRQQIVPVMLRELMLPDGFNPASPGFTIKDVTTELSGPRLYKISLRQLSMIRTSEKQKQSFVYFI